MGAFLAASVVMPGLPIVAGYLLKLQKDQDYQKSFKQWEKFNLWRLRQVIKRMKDAKYVEIVKAGKIPVVKITEKGKAKLLQYDLDDIKLNQTKWDGTWRLVIYDISRNKKNFAESFRKTLKRLDVLKLQESVYLTPFKCEEIIKYFREIYQISDEVQILKVKNLENEEAYKKYFGLK